MNICKKYQIKKLKAWDLTFLLRLFHRSSVWRWWLPAHVDICVGPVRHAPAGQWDPVHDGAAGPRTAPRRRSVRLNLHHKQSTLRTKCKIPLEQCKLSQEDLPLTIYLHLLNPLPLCVHEQVATTWPAPTELCPWSGTSRRSRLPECWALKPETHSTSGTADAPPSALPRLLMTSR